MKQLEETPWWICDENDKNFCAYVDTDSNYFNAEPLLKHLYPDFETFSDKDKDEKLEQVALKYQDIITEHYDKLAKEAFNITEHRLEMKTECVIRSAYFRAPRRYAQWITKQEGIEKEILDIKGLEFKKANFPKILGEFFYDILQQVLKGETKPNIDLQITNFKKQILDGTIPLVKLGTPSAVKKLNTYLARQSKAGELFSKVNKGANAAHKAAIAYNDLIRFWRLNDKHSQIVQGDKIKFLYLKDNPYKLEALAFLDFDLPKKIEDFLDKYADRQQIWESILQNKLENFYSDLTWDYNTNPHINKFDSFEI
jgi:DNA polymerase elongation subunit (family B)